MKSSSNPLVTIALVVYFIPSTIGLFPTDYSLANSIRRLHALKFLIKVLACCTWNGRTRCASRVRQSRLIGNARCLLEERSPTFCRESRYQGAPRLLRIPDPASPEPSLTAPWTMWAALNNVRYLHSHSVVFEDVRDACTCQHAMSPPAVCWLSTSRS